jgi:hypothetical protein
MMQCENPFERKCLMNNRVVYFLALCLLVLTLSAGCAAEGRQILPVNGGEAPLSSAEIESVRDTVLGYLLTSSRLATLPAGDSWQLDGKAGSNGEYRFTSGDWYMIVWPAADIGHHHVVIINRNEGSFWCGYVKPGGSIVDTAYTR